MMFRRREPAIWRLSRKGGFPGALRAKLRYSAGVSDAVKFCLP